MKKIWSKIISAFMIVCMPIALVACGSEPGGINKENFNSVIGMYGTKVLYRPNNYDYNSGSGGTEDNPNEYYGEYAWQILSSLYNVYAIPDTEPDGPLDDYNDYLFTHQELLPYLYDSIRYQVDTYAVTDQDTIIMGADTSKAWNWSFSYDVADENLDAYLALYGADTTSLSGHIVNEFDNSELTSRYNNRLLFSTPYISIYLGTSRQDDTSNYSDYVKALEYVIYSYALDLEPAEMTVQKNFDGTNGIYYRIDILGFNHTTEKTAIEQALEKRKETFEKIGSFVGLVDRQKTKVKNWILENVIGDDVTSSPDTYSVYTGVTETETDGKVTYDFSHATAQSYDLGRAYENTVNEIVNGVCSEVTIGRIDGEDGGEGEDVHIDERFLASQIKEYAGDTFMIQDDANFVLTPENANLPYIQPLEYQSVTLMLGRALYINEIAIAIKYDADLSGTDEGFTDNYIDVIITLNYYNHSLNLLQSVDSDVLRVYDGPYDAGYINAPAKATDSAPTGHLSGFMFKSIGSLFEQDGCEYDFSKESSRPILVGEFNTNVGNGVLKTDVGADNYEGNIFVSQSPLVIVGTTNLRKYYNLLESEIGDTRIEEGHSYVTGRLNSELFSGSDGCDYLEITYKVLKANGDDTTNYKFYTGIQFMNYLTKEYVDGMLG